MGQVIGHRVAILEHADSKSRTLSDFRREGYEVGSSWHVPLVLHHLHRTRFETFGTVTLPARDEHYHRFSNRRRSGGADYLTLNFRHLDDDRLLSCCNEE